MGLLGNFVDGFKNRDNDDVDDYLDDDYLDDSDDYDDDGYEDDEQPKAGLFSSFSKRNKQSSDEQPKAGGVFSRKVVPIQQNGMEITMVRPKNNRADWKELCDCLLDDKAVILNLEGLDDRTAQRIIDQTLGAVYSIGGDLQTISNYIFIASPKNIMLSGEFTKGESDSRDSRSSGYRDSDRFQQRAASGYGF